MSTTSLQQIEVIHRVNETWLVELVLKKTRDASEQLLYTALLWAGAAAIFCKFIKQTNQVR